jgi:hypothetical protein
MAWNLGEPSAPSQETDRTRHSGPRYHRPCGSRSTRRRTGTGPACRRGAEHRRPQGLERAWVRDLARLAFKSVTQQVDLAPVSGKVCGGGQRLCRRGIDHVFGARQARITRWHDARSRANAARAAAGTGTFHGPGLQRPRPAWWRRHRGTRADEGRIVAGHVRDHQRQHPRRIGRSGQLTRPSRGTGACGPCSSPKSARRWPEGLRSPPAFRPASPPCLGRKAAPRPRPRSAPERSHPRCKPCSSASIRSVAMAPAASGTGWAASTISIPGRAGHSRSG